jgi:hypothetical protein
MYHMRQANIFPTIHVHAASRSCRSLYHKNVQHSRNEKHTSRFEDAQTPQKASTYRQHIWKCWPRIGRKDTLKLPKLFLTIALVFVYGLAASIPAVKAQNAKNIKAASGGVTLEILRNNADLPAPVAKMRAEILKAAASGDIEQMRMPADLNEIPPMVAKEKTGDLVAHWKSVSGDGQGREIMAELIKLFRTGFVRKPQKNGGDMYVWPYFAEMPLNKLTPAQEVELLTIISPARMKQMRVKGQYDGYRIGISQDGVWHYFFAGAL